MPFRYKVVSVPPTVTLPKHAKGADPAVFFLEELLNAEAEQGWEFYTIESITIQQPAGCLAQFLPRVPSHLLTSHQVVIFRQSL